MEPRVSIVMPAYREGKAILTQIECVFEAVKLSCELIVVVDSTSDITLPYLEHYAKSEPRLRPLVSKYRPGPAGAIKFGVDHARASVVVIMMGDGSDDAQQIDSLARLVERGVTIAAASRYMRGGQQVGGPALKSFLSRTAGKTLQWFARIGTHDATNSFKAYDADFVRQVDIHSDSGFEVGIELVAKAKRLRKPIAELPTIWLDRHAGESNFQTRKWIPRYLRWYVFAFGPKLTPEEVRLRSSRK